MQTNATCLGPSTWLNYLFDRSDLEALANGRREYGAHDSKMFVRNPVTSGQLVHLDDQFLDEALQVIELGTRHGRVLELVDLLSNLPHFYRSWLGHDDSEWN